MDILQMSMESDPFRQINALFIWRQLLVEKKIAGEIFYLTLDIHLENVTSC